MQTILRTSIVLFGLSRFFTNRMIFIRRTLFTADCLNRLLFWVIILVYFLIGGRVLLLQGLSLEYLVYYTERMPYYAEAVKAWPSSKGLAGHSVLLGSRCVFPGSI